MKANELRIGNYLMYDKKLIYISEITKAGIGMYDGYGLDKNSPIECLKPIEITKEWFLSLGFELKYENLTTGFAKGCYLVESSILPHNKQWTFRKVMNSENSYALKYLKYVHQLQNIYFALTERELTRVDG